MPYYNKIIEMRNIYDYPTFYDEMIGLGRKKEIAPRFICPDCQKQCMPDDSEYTNDCKNLYIYIDGDGEKREGQCLCWSRMHGIRLDEIEMTLQESERRPEHVSLEHRQYLIELLEYQLSLPYKPDFYQEKVRKIYEQYTNKEQRRKFVENQLKIYVEETQSHCQSILTEINLRLLHYHDKYYLLQMYNSIGGK